MKDFRVLITAFALFSFISYSAQGVDDRAKDKTENKANQRVDTRIDQGLDKGFDAIEGIFKKKKKKTTVEDSSEDSEKSSETAEPIEKTETRESRSDANPGAGMFGAMFEAAEWEDSYSFDFRSKAHITTTDKKNKVEEADMDWMVSDKAFAMVMEDPKGKNADAQVIFDYANHSFITLTEEDGEKTGMAIAMNKEQIAAAIEEGVEEGTTSNGSFTKTGRTKTILGYSCSEYTFKDEENEGSMWMTTELNVEMNKIYGMMSSGNSKNTVMPENYPQGYVMEMESQDTKRKDSHHYIITELDTSANIKIDLSSYNVMDPIGMMNSGKK